MSAAPVLNAYAAAHVEPTTTARREYEVIRDAFRHLIFNWEHSAERRDCLEDMITLRCSFLLDRALAGLRLDLDRALDILRRHNDFTTEQQRQQRDILVAAVDNLIDFAAAEEFSMLEQLPPQPDMSRLEEYETLCEQYNLTYAQVENEQVAYAAGIAAWWLTVDAQTYVTFCTQGDERVRAWHLSHEGVTYPKREFPQELIPPIEWGCRCYLTADGFGAVHAALKQDTTLRQVNPIFRESLALGGRIFSAAHPYFSRPLPPEILTIVGTLKSKFKL